MSITLTLSSNSSELSANYFPPIILDGEYECALIDFHSYNSIPNVDIYNNKFHIGEYVIEIPIGSYELNDIVNYIKEQYKRYSPKNIIDIEANNNTMQVRVKSSNDFIYFNKENTIGNIFGFDKKILHPNEYHYSDLPVNIFKVNLLRVESNISVNTYMNNSQSHTLHEFAINVPPGYKIDEIPRNLIYLPVNCREISSLNLQVVDQDGDLINFRGEKLQ
ncbi:hypothetical protein CVS40_6007 [Lucilia cuprina]|nr:hypothetical protein CVS40_6007 [Lucilia cuprina]